MSDTPTSERMRAIVDEASCMDCTDTEKFRPLADEVQAMEARTLSLVAQIDALAMFIIEDVEGEPAENEGACLCAVRIILNLQERIRALESEAEIRSTRLNILMNDRNGLEDAVKELEARPPDCASCESWPNGHMEMWKKRALQAEAKRGIDPAAVRDLRDEFVTEKEALSKRDDDDSAVAVLGMEYTIEKLNAILDTEGQPTYGIREKIQEKILEIDGQPDDGLPHNWDSGRYAAYRDVLDMMEEQTPSQPDGIMSGGKMVAMSPPLEAQAPGDVLSTKPVHGTDYRPRYFFDGARDEPKDAEPDTCPKCGDCRFNDPGVCTQKPSDDCGYEPEGGA